MSKQKSTSKKSKNATRLRLILTDGTIVEKEHAWQTLAYVIERVGCDVVLSLNLDRYKHDLLSNTLSEDEKIRKDQKEICPNYYLYKKSSTNDKKIQILDIIEKGKIDWIKKVEIVDKP